MLLVMPYIICPLYYQYIIIGVHSFDSWYIDLCLLSNHLAAT